MVRKIVFFIVFFGTIFTVSGINNPLPIIITGKITCNKLPVSEVAVTDGISIVKTDKNGKYILNSSTQRQYVYYSLPSGYKSPIIDGVPSFYSKINHQTKKQQIDFVITKDKLSQTKHAFIAVGDPQVGNLEDCELLKLVINDIQKTADTLANKMPVHAISLGDIVADKIELFDIYKQIVAKTKIPFYQVIGNHDMNYNERSEELSTKSFTEKFGPTYYSYNVGNIHYIVLDDVFYYGYTYRYLGYIDENQLSWLEKDLADIKPGSTLIVSFHIPAFFGESEKADNYATTLSNSLMNREALFKILNLYKVHLLAGHSHAQWNTIISDNIFEHTHSAVCAAWWEGEISTDGTPKGYTVYEIDGDNIQWFFKPVGMDRDEQFKIYPIGADILYPDSVIANVYNFDPSWKVEWLENDTIMGEMEQYWGKDPLAKQTYIPHTNKRYPWLGVSDTHHLFKAKIINPKAIITVKITDRFGKSIIKTL